MNIPQHEEELGPFLKDIAGATSVLEIGSRDGYTLARMAGVAKAGARIVSVDLPNGKWGRDNSQVNLENTIKALDNNGFEAHLLLGNSQDEEIKKRVYELGPFDVVFIDGDHTYEGVKADWDNYGHLGEVVVFHDINMDAVDLTKGRALKIEVPLLWNELKEKFPHKEYIHKGKQPLGIGALFMDGEAPE